MSHDEGSSAGSLSTIHGIRVLYLHGSPYEIGKQHGAYLASHISALVPQALDAAAAVIAKTIGVPYHRAQELMRAGRDAARSFIPQEFLLEMQGIADGMNQAGYPMDLEDILLWNSMYDLWCLYAHPDYSDPSDPEEEKGKIVSAGCSSFSAWGDAVVGDALIHGKNMDNLNLPGILEGRILAVVDPEVGHRHAFVTHPGMVGIDGGMNVAGVSMMTQYNAMIDETMRGCGIGIHTRLLLTHSSSIKDAIGSLGGHPHCTGIAFHVADSNANRAAIVNAAATTFAVRHPTSNILFTSNHSNCYPGWYGYEGDNAVRNQQKVYALTDVSSIEAWQTSLRDPDNIWVPASSRFQRYEELAAEYAGKITPDTAQDILSDRFDPYTGKTRDARQPSISNNILATICALYPDDTYKEDDPERSFDAHVANLWSMVMVPKTGDFWLAIQDFPAQYGGYEHFNLRTIFKRLE